MHNEIIYFQNIVLTSDSFQRPFIIFLILMISRENQGKKLYDKASKKTEIGQDQMWTAVKKAENTSFVYTQATPRPVKKIILYDQQKHKHLYELVNDRDVGIYSQYQNIVIKSYNDDDKQTSSTQLQRGMMQTIEDMYSILDEMNQQE